MYLVPSETRRGTSGTRLSENPWIKQWLFIKVVYHSNGQTGWFMVCVNGSQSSGQVNFVPEIAFNASVTFTGKRPRRPETGIKDSFEEMEHEFPFGTFHPEKQDYLFRCSVAPGNFPLGRPKTSCSIYLPTGFPRKLL